MARKVFLSNRPPLPPAVPKSAKPNASTPAVHDDSWKLGAARPKQSVKITSAVLAPYASRLGHFVDAPPEHVAAISKQFLETVRAGTLTQAPTGEIKRVGSSELSVDFNHLDAAKAETLSAVGAAHASKFHYFTSGAGLWSRGGGQIKALVPLNLAELITPASFDRLVQASQLVNAKSATDVLFMKSRDVMPGEDVNALAHGLVSEAKQEIESILAPARSDPRALNPLAMKLVDVALASRKADTYIPFDVWTSEQTQSAVADYLQGFKTNFRTLRFHPDAKVQATIVSALEKYFANADRAGDTHLFGYQVGLPALHATTGEPVKDTARIGEGAGRAKAYLDQSGRTAQLAARGKTTWMFQNIEVFDDLLLRLGAHVTAGKDVSVTLVPQKKGYAGGNPFLVDGKLRLLEQSAVPPELASGNEYFNANTIVQPLHARPPTTLGFEFKVNNTQARAKQNAGDVTLDLDTAGIGGRIGVEYENFKTYDEYRQNGAKTIATYQNSVWARLAGGESSEPARR